MRVCACVYMCKSRILSALLPPTKEVSVQLHSKEMGHKPKLAVLDRQAGRHHGIINIAGRMACRTQYLAIEGGDDVISNRVCVGVEQAIEVVDDWPTVMADGEGRRGTNRRDKAGRRNESVLS